MTHEAQFRDLFRLTYPILARYGRHRGVSGDDLQDLLADTYEVAWRRFEDLPSGDEAVPWLIAVARNHLRNHRRRLQRDRGLLARLGPPQTSTGPGTPDGAADWQAVRRALSRLPSSDRELVLLVAWDELTPAQAAAVLGITPGAARTRLHRARSRLNAELQAHRPPDSNRPLTTNERPSHA